MVTQHLRVNYRLTGGNADIGALTSQLVRIRNTMQIGSADVGITFSMSGWGVPAWVLAVPVSHLITIIVVNHYSVAAVTSIYYASLHAYEYSGASAGFCGGSSIAATVSYAFDLYALIGSR